jgi:hypothetical protein
MAAADRRSIAQGSRMTARRRGRPLGWRKPIPGAAVRLLAALVDDAIGYRAKRRRGALLRRLRALGVTRRELYERGFTSADYWAYEQ